MWVLGCGDTCTVSLKLKVLQTIPMPTILIHYDWEVWAMHCVAKGCEGKLQKKKKEKKKKKKTTLLSVIKEGRVQGLKMQKDRITLSVCVNVPGSDKLKLIVIHTAERPRDFRKTWQPDEFVDYFANQKAWVTMHAGPTASSCHFNAQIVLT